MPVHLRAVLATLLLLASACGGAGDVAGNEQATAAAQAPTTEPPAELVVSDVDTEIGTVLATDQGLTLYGFLPDADASAPTCTGDCASTWPVVTVPGGELPAGMDTGVFSITEHPEAGAQLRAGDWPLYTFAGDEAAGDVNGQGIGDNWFAVAPDGTLIDTDEAAEGEDGGGAANAPAGAADTGPGYGRDG